MRFSDEFLSELRDRNDIADVISSYVDLRVRGSMATGLCPFHNEKTPSFTVYLNTQSYYCFGCGSGGDCITFIKNIENLDYSESVKLLADRCGMALPVDGYDDTMAKLRRRLLEANREAARYFHSCLFTPEGKAGLDYFRKRGLRKETVRHFGLGFAPDKWDSLIRHLRSKGYSESELVQANLAKRTSNGHVIDTFRNKAMFPIIDIKGSVVAFGGRVLDNSKPKYINTSDTPVYKKSQGVFGLNFAKNGSGRTLILCEGYMDTIAYHQAGFTNAVASLGTAFPPEQVKLLSKYADEIILSFDSDEAGQKATEKAIRMLASTPVRIKIAMWDGGKDPDEILRTYGKDKMQAILSSAVSDVEYKLIKSKKTYDTQSDDGKVAYLNKAIDVLVGLKNPIEVDVYASKLANELGVSKEAILAQAEKKSKQKARQERKAAFDKAATFNDEALKKVNPERQRNIAAAKAEEILIASLLVNPDFYFKIRDKVSDGLFATSLNLKIYKLISSRLDEGRTVGVTYFTEDLTDEEIGYLVRLESMRESLGNTVGECLDCLKLMQKEKEEREIKDPSQMSDDEWAKLFKKNKPTGE